MPRHLPGAVVIVLRRSGSRSANDASLDYRDQDTLDYRDQSQPVETKDAPPWWWGVTDQTEPTAPWWEEEKAK